VEAIHRTGLTGIWQTEEEYYMGICGGSVYSREKDLS
jgi:hypothetical protein